MFYITVYTSLPLHSLAYGKLLCPLGNSVRKAAYLLKCEIERDFRLEGVQEEEGSISFSEEGRILPKHFVTGLLVTL